VAKPTELLGRMFSLTHFSTLRALPALAVLVLLYFGIEAVVIVGAIAMRSQERPWKVFYQLIRGTILGEASLILVGIVFGVMCHFSPVLTVFIIVPVLLSVRAFESVARFRKETIERGERGKKSLDIPLPFGRSDCAPCVVPAPESDGPVQKSAKMSEDLGRRSRRRAGQRPRVRPDELPLLRGHQAQLFRREHALLPVGQHLGTNPAVQPHRPVPPADTPAPTHAPPHPTAPRRAMASLVPSDVPARSLALPASAKGIVAVPYRALRWRK